MPSPHAPSTVARLLPASLRLAAALAIVVAVASQYTYSALHTVVNPFSYFGYFTNQSNLFAAFVLAVTAIAALRRHPLRPGWGTVRAAATVYMTVTFVVYNVLLAGLGTDRFTLQWSNDIVHRVVPAYLILDWLVTTDRARIRWSRLWLFLIYPILWCAATLLRGFYVDGFFAYPFLNPASVGAAIPLYVLGIAMFIAALSAGVIGVTRWRSAPS